MKRIIPLFLILMLTSAQVKWEKFMCCGGTAAVTYTGPGDVISGAKLWWGLRAYSAAYASSNGKFVNISRASDSHACDILAATSGGMGNTGNCGTGADNGQSASSFCNATTCTIVTWYDQSGATNCSGSTACDAVAGHATATLTFSCIGSLPCASFVAANPDWYVSPAVATVNQPFTISSVSERTGTFTGFQAVVSSDTAGVCATFYFNSANLMAAYCDTAVEPVAGAAANDNVVHAVQDIKNDATASNLYIDGSSSTTTGQGTSPYANNVGFAYIGTQNAAHTQSLDGKFWEGGVWASGFSGANQTAMNSNQHTYWGF